MSKTIIAGPCSVESQSQLRDVTLALKAMPEVTLIRAGVWKPRTRPGAFEGLGEPALGWMRDLANELGVKYCCEVARPEHVELCLSYGIDTFWLGARTTTNPFMVDELCQALRGIQAHLLVKNPVCPDVRLWLGALERLHKAGIEDLVAVHRGFSMYNNHGYRNAPLWEVAMELRHEHPELPILCDPSHMGGRADLVGPLVRAAGQLDYDGLMVEVHPHPAEALTDAAQQITPQALADVIADWTSTPYPTSVAEAARALDPLRRKIDDIDHDLISLLSQRMAVSKLIASVKREARMPVYQQARWANMMNDRLHQATALGLEADFMKELLEKIHAASVRVQLENGK